MNRLGDSDTQINPSQRNCLSSVWFNSFLICSLTASADCSSNFTMLFGRPRQVDSAGRLALNSTVRDARYLRADVPVVSIGHRSIFPFLFRVKATSVGVKSVAGAVITSLRYRSRTANDCFTVAWETRRFSRSKGVYFDGAHSGLCAVVHIQK